MIDKPSQVNGIPVPYTAGVDELREIIESKSDERWAAFVALGYCEEEEALETLLEYAGSRDWSIRRAAAEALSTHPCIERSLTVLRSLLSDESEYVVRTACEALASIQDHHSRGLILELIRSKDSSTRAVALRALQVIWGDEAFSLVLDLFDHDPEEEVRREAGWSLRAAANPSNWMQLFERFVGDRMHHHRVWACELAEEFGDKSIVARLRPLCQDEDGHVRKAADRALKRLQGVT